MLCFVSWKSWLVERFECMLLFMLNNVSRNRSLAKLPAVQVPGVRGEIIVRISGEAIPEGGGT